MKHIRVFILAALAALALLTLTGCMSSAGKQYHQLFLPVHRIDTRAAGAAPRPLFDKIIMIEDVETDEIYNDYRVVYRTTSYQLNYYSYQFWIKKPGKLVRDVIVNYLRGNRLFKKTITGFTQGDPDLLLKASVYVIEEIDRSSVWFARLQMEFEVRDFKTNKPVLVHSFNRRKQLPYKKVDQLPVILSSILREELDIVVEKLKSLPK
jgi:uncharacterized lipoprotein YmbA